MINVNSLNQHKERLNDRKRGKYSLSDHDIILSVKMMIEREIKDVQYEFDKKLKEFEQGE